jgi:NADPH-dependent 2,4-dienoyl-CoA reductase/sulfur reductase-like enzyme
MARRHVLIGIGPTAVSAAQAIREHDPAAEITFVAADPHGYYSRPGLAYYLAKELPENRLFPFTAQDFSGLQARRVAERAVQIDSSAHEVVLESGQVVAYDRLLIATGSRAIPADVAGAGLDGVVKLDDLDDARDLVRRSHHAKSAVVVGGGATAIEIAEGLLARGVRVHYLIRKERYWSGVLSVDESRLVEERLRRHGVQIHYSAELAAILGEGGRVVAVRTQDGTEIPCEMAAIAIGVTPNSEIARAAGLDCARGVLVDEYLRSSHHDIFAAGDVAEIGDLGTGRGSIEVLWSSAVTKGRIAGQNMATEPVYKYVESVPLNVTRLGGSKITIVGTVGSGKDADVRGITRGDSETWRRLGDADTVVLETPDARVRLALSGNMIVGAVVMGDQALSFALQGIIAIRADVRSLIPRLQAPKAAVSDILNGFWRDWKVQRVETVS